MPIESGTTLGPYEIVERLGAGGMGEVFKARDTRLGRSVALKVLPERFSKDASRRERLVREARAISSLSHPHICALFDVGQENGVLFLVLELLEGETLAELLTRGPLTFDKALTFAAEIARALDVAHHRGIVHRDLKPANVMLTKTGVKLLDFGLAKLATGYSPEPSELSALATEAKPLTEEGSLVGTLQYMAPEQLEGKEADARADIFAFGTLLYEMVTGEHAFSGTSGASLIAAILEREPPALSERQALSPPALDQLVKLCLAKDPDERWRSAGDLARQLTWIRETGAPQGATPRVDASRPRQLLYAAAGLFVGLLVAVGVWIATGPPPRSVARFMLDAAPAQTFAFSNDPNVALSPDGSRVVYGGRHETGVRLYLRQLDELEGTPIPDTESAHSPFFSPDGEWIGFFSDDDRTLRKVSIRGGRSTRLCSATEGHLGASWGEEDTILFASLDGGLAQVSADGGAPVRITTPDAPGDHRHEFPQVLPDGKGILFTVRFLTSPGRSGIAFLGPDDDEPRLVVPSGRGALYSPTGHLLYEDSGNLVAARWDPASPEETGSPTIVLEDVEQTADGPLTFALSRGGTAVYAPGDLAALGDPGQLVFVDRAGRVELVREEQRVYRGLRISPDGRRAAAWDNDGIWLYDLERGAQRRLTFEQEIDPVWTPDGERIVFTGSTGLDGLLWTRVDGGQEREPLLRTPFTTSAHSVSPDGNTLAFYDRQGNLRDIYTLDLRNGPDAERKPFLVGPFNERSPSFSPDGHWLAYTSDESGRDEVYVQAFPGPGAKQAISTAGGRDPVWCPAGGELYYRNRDAVMAVSIQTQPELRIGAPEILFDGDFLTEPYPDSGTGSYDVTPDCRRFLMVAPTETPPRRLNVVLNWDLELERLVPSH